jgi:TldD protein
MADHDLFFSRTGMDRARVQQTVDQALKGADDGELYLEYSQSESFAFDDNRLKAATFDTSQGFGLRAVAGEATGYAHASEISEDAIARAAGTVRAVAHGYSGTAAASPPRTNVKLYTDIDPLETAGFEKKVKLLERDRRLCPRQGWPRAPGVGLAVGRVAAHRDPARRWRAAGRRAPAGAPQRLGHRRSEGGRQESGSFGAGGRIGYDLLSRSRALAGRRSTKRCARRW